MKYSVGVDIGGTKTNIVLLKNGCLVFSKKISTPKTKKGIIKIIEDSIKKIISNIPKSKISGIGIGIPGPLNSKGDLILNPPNIKSLWNLSLAKIIEKDLKVKTVMENDVNCFTLAEAIAGAGKGSEVVLGITLGTGIGGGIVFKKNNTYEVYRGAFGSAGEFGHMVIKFDEGKCSCGNLGCFETYASERFIKRKSKYFSIELEKRARKGDKKAKKIYLEFGKNLGVGLANLINILDPSVVVVGGGFSRASSLFLNEAKKEVKKRVLSTQSKKSVKIKITKLGEFAGAIGAAFLI